MRVLLSLHLLMVGLWLGCVLTEALFERALLGQGPQAQRLLARLHWRVDLWVEIPAFAAVVVTGLALLPGQRWDGWLVFKLVCAGLAVVANMVCVALVARRQTHAVAGDWVAFAAVDHRQHQLGAMVLLGLLGAVVAGLVRAA